MDIFLLFLLHLLSISVASCGFEQMKRQQRKLNFLITQTELYAHFMARKLTGATDAERDAILQHFDEPVSMKPQPVISGVVRTVLDDDYGALMLANVLLTGCNVTAMLSLSYWLSKVCFFQL